MALIAHWPLNGNTNDISGNGLNGTPTNITYTNGKIGQAASFTVSSSLVSVPPNSLLDLSNGGSLSIWVYTTREYPSDTTSTNFRGVISKTISGGTGGQSYFIDWNGTNTTRNLRFGVGGAAGSNSFFISNFNFDSKWQHIAMTWNSSIIKGYVNGILVGTVAISNPLQDLVSQPLHIGRSFNADAYTWIGLLNDIRIFNHILTDMEVQEIARAKILHYTFDDMQEPTTNKFLQFTENGQNPILGDGTPTNLGLDTSNKFRGLTSVKYQTGSSGNFYINDASKIATDLNSTNWSGTIYIKRVDGTPITSVGTYMYVTNNSNDNTIVNTIPVENGWYKIVRNRIGIVSGYPTLFGCYNLGAGVQYYIAMWQIEAKSYDTEYIQSSRTGRVNDYSGFFNHSNIIAEVDTPRWIPEAKIGTGAYQFFGVGGSGTSGNVISFPNATSQLNVGINNPFTISFWIKPVATSAAAVIRKGGQFEIYVTGSNFVYRVWDPTQRDYNSTATYSPNNWYHIVMMHDGVTTGKLYINGNLDRTITVSGTPSGTSGDLTIGAYANRTWSMGGVLDDVRIYSTTLSDKDILDLYGARAEIEQSGVLYAKEFLSNSEGTLNILGLGTTTSYNPYYTIVVNNIGDYTITHVDGASPTVVFYNTNWNTIKIVGQTYTISGYIYDEFMNPIKSNSVINSSHPSGTFTTTSYETRNDGYFRYTFVLNNDSGGSIFFHTNLGNTTSSGTYKLHIKKMQLEYKSYATPFTSSFRPASQLPSTIQFGADEVHETGTANFEDFSTVGITNGIDTYIPLNDNTIRDLSGSSYSITVSSDPIYRGDYYRFDGIDDQINTGNNAVADWNTPFTLMVSVRIPTEYDRQVSVQTAIVGRGSFTGSVGLTINSTNSFNFFLRTSSSSFSAALGTFDRDIWYHLVGTYDGTNIRSYRNGVLSTTTAVSNKDGSPSGTSWLVTPSMAFSGSSGGRLLADMKNVKIFNRALTAEEISIEYNTMFNNEVQIHESGTVYAKDLIQY
jgi:hypothetical protein